MEKIEVKLGKYKGLKVKKNDLKVKEEEIKKSLDFLQNSRAKLITVNKPAKNGNRIEIDFEICQAGARTENGTSKNHPLILGKSHFLPGFEKELEGMKAGEQKEFSLKAPENWPNKKIANKNLDFKVKMNLVQERELPALNDEFAKSLGRFESLSELKKSIKQGLFQEKQIREEQRIRMELIEKVSEDSQMEIPEALINQEKEKMLAEFKMNINSLGLDFERHLKEIKKTVDDLKKDWQKQAEKRVRIGLCLWAIAKEENITVSEEEAKERINHDLKHYPNIEEVKKNIDLKALKEYTKNILRNEKVFELLEKEADIK